MAQPFDDMSYIKLAVRLYIRNKLFTVINVMGLALGILCSAILLLYVNFHFSTDTYHPNSAQVFRLVLDIHTPSGAVEYESGVALPIGEALRASYSQVKETAFCMRFYTAPTISIYENGQRHRFKEENSVAYADANFTDFFSYHFIAGDSRTALTKPQSVLLSEKLAIKYFGSTDVMGKSITINNKADLIVNGVFSDPPRNSDLKFEMLISLSTLKTLNPNYQEHNFTWIGSNNWLFVRLPDAISASEIDRQLPSFVKEHLGEDFSHWNFHLQPLADMHFDTRYSGVIRTSVLWILSGVALALLCIVCINYINLSIAQSYHRAKEIGIRKCLGGGRPQLFLQLMTETGIVVLLAVVLGLLGCHLVLPAINSWMRIDLALVDFFARDTIGWLVLFVTALVLLNGYFPAVVLSGFDPLRALSGTISKSGGVSQFFKQSLIVFQYAVALLFLIITFIVIDQVDYMLKSDMGFDKESIINIKVPKATLSQLEAFRNEIEKVPGILGASLHHQPPMASATDGGFIKFDNRGEWEDFLVRDRWADDQFTELYSLELVAGRNVILQDSSTEILINETFLRKLNTTADEVLGKSVFFDNSSINGRIVGVVRDFHHRSLQNEIEALAIYSFPPVFSQLGVRFDRNGGNHAFNNIEKIWKNSFPDEVLDFVFLDESVSRMYQVEQITGKMMNAFAVVSIFICCLGMLGLSVFSTRERAKEIGIRKVLGANVINILLMLSKQYLALLLVGCAIAIPLAYWVTNQWLDNYAYRIPVHWIVFAAPGLIMAILSLLVVSSQSLRTALKNPCDTLKHP